MPLTHFTKDFYKSLFGLDNFLFLSDPEGTYFDLGANLVQLTIEEEKRFPGCKKINISKHLRQMVFSIHTLMALVQDNNLQELIITSYLDIIIEELKAFYQATKYYSFDNIHIKTRQDSLPQDNEFWIGVKKVFNNIIRFNYDSTHICDLVTQITMLEFWTSADTRSLQEALSNIKNRLFDVLRFFPVELAKERNQIVVEIEKGSEKIYKKLQDEYLKTTNFNVQSKIALLSLFSCLLGGVFIIQNPMLLFYLTIGVTGLSSLGYYLGLGRQLSGEYCLRYYNYALDNLPRVNCLDCMQHDEKQITKETLQHELLLATNLGMLFTRYDLLRAQRLEKIALPEEKKESKKEFFDEIYAPVYNHPGYEFPKPIKIRRSTTKRILSAIPCEITLPLTLTAEEQVELPKELQGGRLIRESDGKMMIICSGRTKLIEVDEAIGNQHWAFAHQHNQSGLHILKDRTEYSFWVKIRGCGTRYPLHKTGEALVTLNHGSETKSVPVYDIDAPIKHPG